MYLNKIKLKPLSLKTSWAARRFLKMKHGEFLHEHLHNTKTVSCKKMWTNRLIDLRSKCTFRRTNPCCCCSASVWTQQRQKLTICAPRATYWLCNNAVVSHCTVSLCTGHRSNLNALEAMPELFYSVFVSVELQDAGKSFFDGACAKCGVSFFCTKLNSRQCDESWWG